MTLAHSDEKDIYKSMRATQKAEGQTEDMDGKTCTANTVETTAGETAAPAKKRIESITVLLLAPNPHTR